MATTNDIQEEEPPTTALEKQVKTLAAVVERLTRQNHDLEEQLRQKNAALDNQGADQEGTSADRRNQEGPQASNAPSRPEHQNVSLPSLADTAPPPIIAEMQGKFLFSLYKNDPKTMSEVFYRATKYINAEDALLAREERLKKRERQEDARQDQGRKKARTGDRRDERRLKPLGGRFTSFTPLTAPMDQVLMQIKDEGALTFPGKLKSDPNKRSRDKYCHFHRDHGHETADCYDLKQQIEALIRQGKLQKFINKERIDPPPQDQHPRRDNERPRPPIGDIRMIIGGTTAAGLSKKACKTYLRMIENVQVTGAVPKIALKEGPIIGFSEEDARRLHHPHDDVLVVSLQVEDYNMHRVLVDNGNSADILYYPVFQQMRIDKERLIQTNAPLVGFGGSQVFPLGAVTLSVVVGDYP
ncbi:uncharacterized protein LOC126704712 [Quercus robur]|uniref:uncharacterized protein LOC126704712 n=1 Tax=Quercus robur TaxID=38942 RepID=UPI002163079A|nr:uncharacterized protein LOC126704712 [Quercus robur]